MMEFSSELGGMERVQAYSDAVLSIIATVLVVPLMKVDEASKKEILLTGGSLFQVLTEPYRLESFAMYWVSFWIVFVVWTWHGRKFRGYETGNTIAVYANGIELLATSLLPFTASTASNADSASGGDKQVRDDMIRMFYFNILGIASAHLFFQLVANFTHEAWFRRLFLKEAAIIFLVCMAAIILSMFYASYAAFVYVLIPIVSVWFNTIHKQERRALVDDTLDDAESERREESLLVAHSSQRLISQTEEVEYRHMFKRRLESFTDGVFAITATLIILDIHGPASCNDLTSWADCVLHWDDGCRPRGLDLIPNRFECYYNDTEAAERRKWLLMAYILTFLSVNMLWVLHHHLFEKIINEASAGDSWTRIVNGHFCICVSFIPFTFSLLVDYAIEPLTKHKLDPFSPHGRADPDEDAARTATIFACMMLFGASTCLFLLLIHHQWKSNTKKPITNLDYARFLLIPVATFISIAVLAARVNELVVVPIIVLPLAFLFVRWYFVKPDN
mmetsp:Transcript_30966/g.49682  ORF Transcript_30966/g.49682 Transcript_30966/m.49682 type:complete len:505 (-) Transcript_30966:3756-5270(-)